jgi:FkbM family methyltransferase
MTLPRRRTWEPGGADSSVADRDLAEILAGVERPVIYDVGANLGQSVHRFRNLFPNATLHAFEPSPATFRDLEVAASGMHGVVLVNAGVGATPGRMELIERDQRDMSSFLDTDVSGWSEEVARTPVEVVTLDEYARGRIDLLKSDTQGFDLEVLRGAESLIRSHRIGLVFLEVNFAPLYVGQPRFDELLGWLLDRGLELVGVYNLYSKGHRAGWCDVLFIDPLALYEVDLSAQLAE